MLVAEIFGEARHRARWRPLTAEEEAVAIAELRTLACGRADLLAEVAGLFEGTSEGELDEPLVRQAAQLCRLTGADEALIPGWITEGRRRAQAARKPPHGGRPVLQEVVNQHRRHSSQTWGHPCHKQDQAQPKGAGPTVSRVVDRSPQSAAVTRQLWRGAPSSTADQALLLPVSAWPRHSGALVREPAPAWARLARSMAAHDASPASSEISPDSSGISPGGAGSSPAVLRR